MNWKAAIYATFALGSMPGGLWLGQYHPDILLALVVGGFGVFAWTVLYYAFDRDTK